MRWAEETSRLDVSEKINQRDSVADKDGFRNLFICLCREELQNFFLPTIYDFINSETQSNLYYIYYTKGDINLS